MNDTIERLRGGETDLGRMLAGLAPLLHAERLVFCVVSVEQANLLWAQAIGVVRETEGITLILEEELAQAHGLQFGSPWARITLQVHSALESVGLLAVVATRLAQAQISTNPLAGYYHDHLLVPWARRAEAAELLGQLQKEAQG